MDDPLLCLPGEAEHLLTVALLLLTRVFGFPLELPKASAGSSVKWIGAQLEAGTDESGSIPEDKTKKLLSDVEKFLKAPVVGTKQLRSFAGGMAFVAGLVPVLSPSWCRCGPDRRITLILVGAAGPWSG